MDNWPFNLEIVHTASFKIEISKVQDFGNFELLPMRTRVQIFCKSYLQLTMVPTSRQRVKSAILCSSHAICYNPERHMHIAQKCIMLSEKLQATANFCWGVTNLYLIKVKSVKLCIRHVISISVWLTHLSLCLAAMFAKLSRWNC